VNQAPSESEVKLVSREGLDVRGGQQVADMAENFREYKPKPSPRMLDPQDGSEHRL
jgi:hypothetical protein